MESYHSHQISRSVLRFGLQLLTSTDWQCTDESLGNLKSLAILILHIYKVLRCVRMFLLIWLVSIYRAVTELAWRKVIVSCNSHVSVRCQQQVTGLCCVCDETFASRMSTRTPGFPLPTCFVRLGIPQKQHWKLKGRTSQASSTSTCQRRIWKTSD